MVRDVKMGGPSAAIYDYADSDRIRPVSSTLINGFDNSPPTSDHVFQN